MPDENVWLTFDRYLAGELPFEEMAEWVHATPELVRVLDPDEYVALTDLASRGHDAASDATQFISRLYTRYRPGQLVRDRAERIARGMLEGEINVAAGTRALARLKGEGHDFIPDAFVGIAAQLDERPSNDKFPRGDIRGLPSRLAAAKEMERKLRAPALTAAKRLLEALEQ